MELIRVKLDDLRPSDENVRAGYEGLEEFADLLELTPGRPGEPAYPLVVTRDANVFRIRDGERRYRAMKLRGKVDECYCYVFDDIAEADAFVVMMLSNARVNWSAKEMGSAVQQAMILNVPEEKVDALAGRKGAGRAARRALKHKGSKADQLTLDNMLYAAEVAEAGGTEEDYERVLNEVYNPQYEKNSILRRIAEDREREELEAAIAQVVADHGLAVADRKPKGAELRKSVYGSSMTSELVLEEGPTWAAAGCTLVRPKQSWSPWEVYDEARELSEEEQEAVKAKNAMRRLRTAGEKRRAEWVYGKLMQGGGRTTLNAVEYLVAGYYNDNKMYDVDSFAKKAGFDPENDPIPVTANAWMTADAWVVIDHIGNDECNKIAEGCAGSYDTQMKRHVELMRALKSDGYVADEGELDFLSAVEHALAQSRKGSE